MKILGRLERATEAATQQLAVRVIGRVTSISEAFALVEGFAGRGAVGTLVRIIDRSGHRIAGEVISFQNELALVMGYAGFDNVGPGCEVELALATTHIAPDQSWRSRVIDGLAQPLDNRGPLRHGPRFYPLRASPPPPGARGEVNTRLDVGVAALNTFVTSCNGQRLGIFAGSGVGKTTLMGMLARHSRADVNVIALVGERGKELADFLSNYLTDDLRARTVLVVSTSDEAAVLRRRAVQLAVTIAEFFRDEGLKVLFLMDSITRFAMALRQIGITAGEPTGPGGYPASVMAELPRLIERLGPLQGRGAITAFLTVLIEGDDLNDPVGDAVRGFVDGHIVLDRKIADRGRYPPIDIVRSISRTMPNCNRPAEAKLVQEALRLEAIYADIEDLYKLSLYKIGTDAETDRAIRFHALVEEFLGQPADEFRSLDEGFSRLGEILARSQVGA